MITTPTTIDPDEIPVEIPIAYAKCVDPDLQEDVDAMILDYLIFKTTNILLKECESRKNSDQDRKKGDNHLIMVDVFLQIFKAQHPDHSSSDALPFRLDLLRFTTMFVRRSNRDLTTPTQEQLQSFRRRNTERARRWYKGQPHRVPGPPSQLEAGQDQSGSSRQTTRYDRDQSMELPKYSPGTNSLSLIDLLPTFMSLSAVFGSGNKPSTKWMVLAAEFMLQAAYERRTETEYFSAVQEAFAWGCYSSEEFEGDDEDYEVDAMFRDGSTDTEYVDWDKIRAMHLEELLPGPSFGVKSSHDVGKFERDVCEYLRRLSQCMPLPIIAQLELGQLDGFSKQETEAFKKRIDPLAYHEMTN